MPRVLSIIFIVLYVYIILSSITVVLLENRNPVKSLSWILVLILLPGLGLIFYIALGQNYRKKKFVDKKTIQHLTDRPVASFDISKLDTSLMDNNQLNLINMLYRNSGAVGYAFNKVEILSDGVSTFDSFFEAIENAKDHIHIEFFIFADDEISNRMRELLIRKAKSGVRVRMIYDYWGSLRLSMSAKFIKSLKDAGVYVHPFLPLRLRLGRSKINYRNHRKIVVVDGKVGFTGGINVADRYFKGNYLGVWRDTVVRIEGAAIHGLQMQFLLDWHFVEKKLITAEKYFPAPEKFGQNLIQIVSSGPDTDWEAIMQGIASAIMSATKYVYIHSPYFIPNELVLGCVQMAALSGVDVRLMIPKRSDSRFTDASTSSYMGQIMEAGVKVLRYKEGFLHSKAIVIDDFISIVGSCNMDERSFNQNFEVNAFIYENTAALQLRNLFIRDMEKCEMLTLDEWNNRKNWQKLKESCARLFSPLQ
ncbi:cardiolipin synthase [Paludibacter sp. 221]|uniref:cardiolipin synthase n=1 Tax=Paludibacter sp. 221 TaxID=2302939 RepID=UPI0013D66BC2|nr:cardiolipin synthase [Paludibacter sp. 221]NDV47563.1 cardiolipin synthase [Paludibacter sp. 221]